MEAKEITKNLHCAVKHEGNTVVIIGYNKGWVEVENEATDEIFKVRAKTLTKIEGAETKADLTDEKIEEFDPNEATKDDGETIKVACPLCKNEWDTLKRDNFICPKCKHMFSIKLHPRKEDYVVGLGATESGRDTMDINDPVACDLRSMAVEDVMDFVCKTLCTIDSKHWFSKANAAKWKVHIKDLGTDFDCYEVLLNFFWKKYSHLNLGMQRMNLGNLLRGSLNRQTKADETK